MITGGAGGIGAAVAAGFAAEGARVVTLDLAGADVDVDVSDADAVVAAVSSAFGERGRNVLVTLAGGSLGTPRGLTEASVADVDAVIDVNVKGTLHACRAAVPFLAEGSAIVTCGSIGARQPSPVTGVAYAAAKAAVGGLTRKLAAELGPSGVRVNAVAPGLVLTDRLRGMFDAMPLVERQSVLDGIALRRLPGLAEVVDPVLFLASDGASYITGVTLDVNGGRFMPL